MTKCTIYDNIFGHEDGDYTFSVYINMGCLLTGREVYFLERLLENSVRKLLMHDYKPTGTHK